jgi:poly(hydroxyalkanoate) depolymerase family esterase
MDPLGETAAVLARLGLQVKSVGPDGTRRRNPSALAEHPHFTPNPGALRMWSYAPADLPQGAPLVVVLHGCTQSAADYANGAGWLTLADRFGFAVLCPEQVAANNPNRCFNWFQPEDVARDGGEAASIRAMVAILVDALKLDPARVFVTGLSAGGAMTSVLLATYPEVFAAGAIVAGLPYRAADGMQQAFGAMFQPQPRSPGAWGDLVRAASAHAGAWPRVSIWHGEADSTVRFANASEIAKQWLDVHGLPATPAATEIVDGHRRAVWTDAGGEPVIEAYMIAGLGHGVPLASGEPDGCGAPGPFALEAGISSSSRICEFWGLSERAPSRDAAEPTFTAPAWSVPPTLPMGGGRVDVEAVIAKALAAAGLTGR